MSVVVVGLNDRSVTLPVLESMAVADERLPKALHALAASDHLGEVVVLSTCQRTEIYATASRYHGAVSDIRNFLADWSGQPPEAFAGHLYEFHDGAAVRHLFKVAGGLESAVLGEGEILGQLRRAWEAAHSEGTTGPVLALLFRAAQEAGKRVRSETAIARGTTSLSHAAVALAEAELGSLAGRTILVLGAGEMGESMAQALAGTLDEGRLLVANRTWQRATELAARCGGRAIEWSARASALAEADVVLTATGAPGLLVTAGDLERVLAERGGRPLLIVDIAVPRDVDPDAGRLPGITVLDMDAVTSFAERALHERRRELPAAHAILDEEFERYAVRTVERQAAPLVAALHERADTVRTGELERFQRRLADLTPDQRGAVEALSRAIVAKLLHDPTVALKAAAGTPAGEAMASALRELFHL